VRITATGPELTLNPEATQNIGLALHELATNAIKYGALSVPEGTITVEWQLEPSASGNTQFRMTWRELNGPQVKPPDHNGFGHIVLQRMTGETLGGSVKHEFPPRGVIWTLEVQVAAILTPSVDGNGREAT
jgi:two-component sensor histidine kinase